MSYKLTKVARDQIISSAVSEDDIIYLRSSPAEFDHQAGKICTLFSDSLNDNHLLELILYRNFKSVMQNSFQPATEKLDLLKDIASMPTKFMNLEFNMLEEGSAVQDITFTHKSKRDDVMTEICQFSGLNTKSARSVRALQVAEELIMNAQVNAPGTKPTNDRMVSYLKVEFTDRLISFSAFDYYGTLDYKKFFKKIESGLVLGYDKSINFGKGGAGLGSSLIYKNCDSIVLGVIPNNRTRVSIIMPLSASDRVFDEIQRSIHIIDLK